MNNKDKTVRSKLSQIGATIQSIRSALQQTLREKDTDHRMREDHFWRVEYLPFKAGTGHQNDSAL